MDRQKAYEILNQALGQITTTRQNHNVLIQALNTLMVPEKKTEVSEEQKPEKKE